MYAEIEHEALPPFAGLHGVMCASLAEIARLATRGAAELVPRPVTAVHVCISRFAPSRVSWWRTFKRRCVASVAGEFNHVEMLLTLGADTYVAYTVDQPDPGTPRSGVVRRHAPVSMDATYPASRWIVAEIGGMSAPEMLGVQYFLEHQLGKPMDSWGMYANFAPVLCWFVADRGVCIEYDRYFCSQLVAAALRWVWLERMQHVAPHRCTPAQLYALLHASGADMRVCAEGTIMQPGAQWSI
jgi:hypothetical protein